MNPTYDFLKKIIQYAPEFKTKIFRNLRTDAPQSEKSGTRTSLAPLLLRSY